ncbi:TPA: hypothetical protein OGP30_003520 [Escherichia coli]|uniref:hypothetical protein n=1 Tax=Escherichia coli TaxID=562 RepID=UPI000CFDAF57|nr:hypothetical protein [Escherichia coli]MBS9012832.1 hypothetical protein [Escherichia coli]HAI0065755.1 hypothetical protein [Escherichia coli]HAM4835326.1 hypothetical protein [Escherichia coli]HCQ0337267.1 hypothetical protein [Escherichia coli]
MKEKPKGVNRKMTNDGEEKSGKMKKLQDGKKKKIRYAKQTGLQILTNHVLIASCRIRRKRFIRPNAMIIQYISLETIDPKT